MNRHLLWTLTALLPVTFAGATAGDRPAQPPSLPHRSPADVAIVPATNLALAANRTADSVTLVDLDSGKVLVELPCGCKPTAVACAPDGKQVAVSNLWSGTLTLLERVDRDLRPIAEVPVGYQPRGLVFSPDGKSLYVALAGSGEVVWFDCGTRKVTQRWAAPIEPRTLALTRDGHFLAAGSARSATVRCWDTRTGQQVCEQTYSESFNLHGLSFTADDRHVITCQVKDRQHSITKSNIENGWAVDSRLGRAALRADGGAEACQVALDLRGRAVGDPCGVACSRSGDWLAIPAAGTHELLLIRSAAILWTGGEAQDFIDDSLAVSEAKFRRVALGGRPVAVRFLEDGSRAVVANYLLDALQVVEVATGKVVRTIALGGPDRPSLARQGEIVFYDAQRSHHQWFSCHTCHPDGHTSGRLFDTLNDDSLGNPKLSPSLRGVARTGPWTWHGWQKDLGSAVEKSLTDTLYGKKPAADDVRAVVAFLATLDHPPNPNRRAAAAADSPAQRGKALFEGKAHCVRCHHGEGYTSTKTFDVKLEPDGSPYEEWNPPSLRGVIDRGPYLHDGRAATLDELLRLYHNPEKLGGARLTTDERRELIEFLNSL